MSTVIQDAHATGRGELDDWLREMGARALALDALRDLRGRGDLTADEAETARRRLLEAVPHAGGTDARAA
jgi:hypothetical protein